MLDVSSAESVERCFKDVEAAEGTPSILVNNAGVTRDGLLMRMSAEDWQAVLDTDLTAVYRTCKAVMRGMMKARRGRIVNIASVVGVMGNAGQTQLRGRQGRHDRLQQEPGPGGRVARHHRQRGGPGLHRHRHDRRARASQTRTALLAQVPLGRLGSPEDIAHAVAFLASPEAGYITGETLHVNGGMYMI